MVKYYILQIIINKGIMNYINSKVKLLNYCIL